MGVGGRTENTRLEDVYAAAAHLIVDVCDAWNNRDPSDARFLASNNLALPSVRAPRALGVT